MKEKNRIKRKDDNLDFFLLLKVNFYLILSAIVKNKEKKQQGHRENKFRLSNGVICLDRTIKCYVKLQTHILGI